MVVVVSARRVLPLVVSVLLWSAVIVSSQGVANETAAPTTVNVTDAPTAAPTNSSTSAPTSFNCNNVVGGKTECKAFEACYFLKGKCRNRPPTKAPTSFPTRKPTSSPTTGSPTLPTRSPTTFAPTQFPTAKPTRFPTNFPTRKPTKYPTTRKPTQSPTESPTPFGYVPPTNSPTTSAPTPGSRELEGSFRVYGLSLEAARSKRAAIQESLVDILGAKQVTARIIQGATMGTRRQLNEDTNVVTVEWFAVFFTSNDRRDAEAVVDGDFKAKLESSKDAFGEAQISTSLIIDFTDVVTTNAETSTNPMMVVGVSLGCIVGVLVIAVLISFRADIATTAKTLKTKAARGMTMRNVNVDDDVHTYSSTRDINAAAMGRVRNADRSRNESNASAEAPRIAMARSVARPASTIIAAPAPAQQVRMGSRNTSAASGGSVPSAPDIDFAPATSSSTRSFSPQFTV